MGTREHGLYPLRGFLEVRGTFLSKNCRLWYFGVYIGVPLFKETTFYGSGFEVGGLEASTSVGCEIGGLELKPWYPYGTTRRVMLVVHRPQVLLNTPNRHFQQSLNSHGA